MTFILPCAAEWVCLRLDRHGQFIPSLLLWGLGRAEKSLNDNLWPWRPGLIGKKKTGAALMMSVPVFGCFIFSYMGRVCAWRLLIWVCFSFFYLENVWMF